MALDRSWRWRWGPKRTWALGLCVVLLVMVNFVNIRDDPSSPSSASSASSSSFSDAPMQAAYGNCVPQFEKGTMGVVYIYYCSHEERCPAMEEAIASATSLRHHSPGIENITLFTNYKMTDPVFTQVREITNVPEVMAKRSKIIGMCQTPYEKTLYLDADTLILDDLSSMFEILDVYDYAAARRVNDRVFDSEHGLQDSFNSGVLLYRMNHHVAQFYEAWQSHYLDFPESDQRPMWQAMREPHVRLKMATLPPIYNLLLRSESYLISGKVKILHIKRAQMGRMNVTDLNRHPYERRVFRNGRVVWNALTERSKIFEHERWELLDKNFPNYLKETNRQRIRDGQDEISEATAKMRWSQEQRRLLRELFGDGRDLERWLEITGEKEFEGFEVKPKHLTRECRGCCDGLVPSAFAA
eukprot:TRINITY_DN14822_c0_g1_i1.p1 TRINITY_DN14822_c0_g1~~TRINITY_DN14822_c0_g1_i1.p1  ORF type:complete len:413 (+),score=82.02 TRINITY_DN14822_c0_g1_i1:164-1402(+)